MRGRRRRPIHCITAYEIFRRIRGYCTIVCALTIESFPMGPCSTSGDQNSQGKIVSTPHISNTRHTPPKIVFVASKADMRADWVRVGQSSNRPPYAGVLILLPIIIVTPEQGWYSMIQLFRILRIILTIQYSVLFKIQYFMHYPVSDQYFTWSAWILVAYARHITRPRSEIMAAKARGPCRRVEAVGRSVW
jgi:hypothetical protein